MTLAATPGTWIDFTQPRAAGNQRLRFTAQRIARSDTFQALNIS